MRWVATGVTLDFLGALVLLGVFFMVVAHPDPFELGAAATAIPALLAWANHVVLLPELSGTGARAAQVRPRLIRGVVVIGVGLVGAVVVGFVAGYLAAGLASLVGAVRFGGYGLPIAIGVLIGIAAGGATVGWTGSLMRPESAGRARDCAGGAIAALVAAVGSSVLLGWMSERGGWTGWITVAMAAVDALALLPHLLLTGSSAVAGSLREPM